MSEEFQVTERSMVQLFGGRGSHRKQDIYAAIDASLYGTVAYSIGDQPYATPTMIWRQGDYIYWHGSAGSRMLKTVAAGVNVSVTFVHVDGFVLSRLASAHAMNYRSVMVFGNAEPVQSLEERRNQLKLFLTRLFPGRWDEVKQPSLDELNGIIMVRMRIQEGSLKRRSGLPGDGRPVFGGEKLYEQICWAGALPIASSVGPAESANRLHESIGVPAYIADFAQRFGLQQTVDQTSGGIRAEVLDARQVTKDVKLFRLARRAGYFPAVEAGAHIKVGVVLPDRTRDWRQYSVVNSDAEGRWLEVAVLRDAGGQGGSRYMHDELRPGAVIEVFALQNEFPLDRNATHSILIAGGIGITPILAMARALASFGAAEAHYSARGAEEAAFLEEMQALKSIKTTFYDTSAGPQGRMNLEAVLGDYVPGRHVYICGPQGLIGEACRVAESLGYPPEALHSEAFAAPAPKSTDLPIEVRFARSGKYVIVGPDQTLLDAALAEGIQVNHSCKRGECGLCVTGVIDGQPDHRDRFLKPEQRRQDDKMCVCVSRARSRSLVLDL